MNQGEETLWTAVRLGSLEMRLDKILESCHVLNWHFGKRPFSPCVPRSLFKRKCSPSATTLQFPGDIRPVNQTYRNCLLRMIFSLFCQIYLLFSIYVKYDRLSYSVLGIDPKEGSDFTSIVFNVETFWIFPLFDPNISTRPILHFLRAVTNSILNIIFSSLNVSILESLKTN